MRRATLLLGILFVGILFVGWMAMAQAGSTDSGESTSKTLTPAPASMGADRSDSVNTAWTNFSKGWETLSTQFKGLQEHFNSMMALNDLTALKNALNEHQKLLNAIQSQMNAERKAYQHVMTMSESGKMHASMGSHGTMAHGNIKPTSGMMGGGTKGSAAGNKTGGK